MIGVAAERLKPGRSRARGVVVGCGWCGTWLPTPYCPDDGPAGLFYCVACGHFNMLDRRTGQAWRIRNGHEAQ
jgi:hypothetical protein